MDVASRPQFLVSNEEECNIQDFMGTALKELDNETPLQDASNHPGMGLLLSLSDKLAPSPSGPSTATMVMTSQASPSADAGPLTKAQGLSSPVVPPSLASPASSFFNSSCTSFDHSMHLDSIASAASEAAATQYKESAAIQNGHTEDASPSDSLASSDMVSFAPSSSNAYLHMLRHTAFKESKSPLGGQILEKMHSSPPSFLLGKASAPTGSVAGGVQNSVMMDNPTLSSQPVLSHVPSVPDASMPRVFPGTPLLDDEMKQRKVIEDAVRNLNAHHQLAQSAALRHHEALGMTVPPPSAPKASLLVATSTVQAAAEDPFSASMKRKVDADTKHTKRTKSEDPKLNETGTNETMQKRFQCPKCSRAFARAYNLNTHLSTHDPDPSRAKPFPCPYRSCRAEGGRSFSRKHDLQRHVASVHEWEPEPGVHGDIAEVGEGQETGGLASLGLGAPGKKFRCEQCGRGFVRRDALRRHHCGRSMSSPAGKDAPGLTKTPAFPVPPLASQVAPHVELPRSDKDTQPVTSEQRSPVQDTALGSSKQADAKPVPMERNPATNVATASV
ncbi:hypothetical protein MEQU1_001761 [Malassezia equina]|uniref:C2H2-type domain-containing protein n=1 Tax=Malassezia equina TaxID=1381935 RepID=A0AAF0IZ48_9BASI|nr:hypothetical protein MEQU1_001761 [Malassezia equina]